VHVPVGVHYQSDVRQVEQALLNAARRHRSVMRKPSPEVRLMSFGDSAVNFELLVWIDVRRVDKEQLLGEINFHIWDVLAEQNISIPYPQRDLYLQPAPGIERIVRAMRNENRAAPPTKPSAPAMEPIDSYLRWSDAMPHNSPTSVAGDVVAALRSAALPGDRTQHMRTMLMSLFKRRSDDVRTYADDVIEYLAALEVPVEPTPTPIDHLPS
jgi:hypothetical protein